MISSLSKIAVLAAAASVLCRFLCDNALVNVPWLRFLGSTALVPIVAIALVLLLLEWALPSSSDLRRR